MERTIIISDDNGLTHDDYSKEELSEWLSKSPSERFTFFLSLSNFFCSLTKKVKDDTLAFHLKNPMLNE